MIQVLMDQSSQLEVRDPLEYLESQESGVLQVQKELKEIQASPEGWDQMVN